MSGPGFAARHGLREAEGEAEAERVLAAIAQRDLKNIRISFPDQHGILRGKTLMAGAAASALADGVSMTTTLLAKDTAHRTVFPVFSAGGGFGMAEMDGGGDFLMLPDPKTFRVLPWAPDTGHMLADIYFTDGTPVPFATRHIYRRTLAQLAAQGFDFMAGLEVEFHLFKLEDACLKPEQAGQPAQPPVVSLLAHGFQYLTEIRADELDPAVQILRRGIEALGLPLRSIEVEFGPSQVEFTFQPGTGLEPADTMVLLRNAVKQIARRNGLHATFMCRPGIANVFSSGWHLHQSLVERKTGQNVFVSQNPDELLSPLAKHYIAGLLRHARATSVFTTPTINGYKRYRPYSLAPDRAIWARDNRGVMIRALGTPGDGATRIENRIGEPAANPYLYMAAQIVAGMDGVARKLDPGPPADTPYEMKAPALPKSLMEAVAETRESALLRDAFSDRFIDYLLFIKEAEIARFLSEVTDWEQREYFEIF